MQTIDLNTLPLDAQRHCAKLPEYCYALHACLPCGERIIVVNRGETGYYRTTLDSPELSVQNARGIVDRMNQKLGVTAAQRMAMVAGSLHGFEAPIADADKYLDPRYATAFGDSLDVLPC